MSAISIYSVIAPDSVFSVAARCDACHNKINERWEVLHYVVFGECKQPREAKERVGASKFHQLCAEKRQARSYLLQHRLAAIVY